MTKRKKHWPEGYEHLEQYDPKDFPPASERPVAAEYDADPEKPEAQRLVYRPFDDLEYADHLHRQETAAAEAAKPVVHPLVAQVATMSEADKAALKEALA